jgi:hypothetical protein
MASKRDYEAIAKKISTVFESLNESYEVDSSYIYAVKDGIKIALEAICLGFAEMNPRFDKKKFLKACKVNLPLIQLRDIRRGEKKGT